MKDCHIHLSTLFGPAEPPEVFLKKAADAGIDGGTIMSLPPASFRVDPERSQYWKDRLDFILEYTSHTPGFNPFFWIDPTEKTLMNRSPPLRMPESGGSSASATTSIRKSA